MKLQPTRDNALVDLIDRILVKGVILHADLVISVSGIPLIGVSLKAAIAGMKTMLDYGMMEAWDESIRRYALESAKEAQEENEEAASGPAALCHHRDLPLDAPLFKSRPSSR